MQPEDLELLVTLEMPFGKHKGKALKDLPWDYVWWLKTKADNVSPDLRAALNAL